MAKPHRIAFVSEHASPLAVRGGVDAGGQNVYVDEVSRHLGAMGYEVDIFTRRDSPDLPAIVDWGQGVRVIHVPAGPVEWRFKDELWPWMPDFRDWTQDFMARQGEPYHMLHGNFWMAGWVVAEIKRRLGTPAVQIFHATGKTKQRHQGSADTSPTERVRVEIEVIGVVDRVIAQCPAEQVELIEDYGAEPEKVVVIPSAVNTELYRPVPREEARRYLGIDPDPPLVVYVGRMLPRKDVRNLLRGVAVLRARSDLPVQVMLVGGETAEPDPVATPEIGVLQQLAEELGIADQVTFTGKRQPDVLRYYYGAANVAVTTPWYEPFGLTPLEAMACARPIVASAVGGITYTVTDSETGYLVAARDPEALAERLERILRDPRLQERMGSTGRQRVEQHFTWRRVAERTAALYESLPMSSHVQHATAAG